MRLTFATSSLIALLALAGCVDPASGPAPGGPSVGPGSVAVSATGAAAIFSQVCVETAPSFAAAPEKLRALPFAQNTATGTYYHRTLDLSIKLMPRTCSMVFGSREEPLQLGIMLSATVSSSTPGNKIAVDLNGDATASGPGGTRFEFFRLGPLYRAQLIAGK